MVTGSGLVGGYLTMADEEDEMIVISTRQIASPDTKQASHLEIDWNLQNAATRFWEVVTCQKRYHRRIRL